MSSVKQNTNLYVEFKSEYNEMNNIVFQELRAAFNAETVPNGKKRLFLSAAVAAGKTNIDNGYEISSIVP